jgi:hypothetical protein
VKIVKDGFLLSIKPRFVSLAGKSRNLIPVGVSGFKWIS